MSESETHVHSQTLPVGEQLEDFRITAVLGQGGFGITYKATEETLRRQVAIKEYLPQQFAFRDGAGRVRPRTADDDSMFRWGLDRFLEEARTLALFRHPNIVSVMRFFERNGTAYLVMEFEEGQDLGQWLEDRPAPDEERLVHGILGPLLEGLARVHDKGLLHRDIKPGNIFIRRDGSPVLLDFGASRPHGSASSQLTSIISVGYSPFEQYGTGAQQGPWSDLYALAGTMYRVIAGRPPVDAIARAQGSRLEPAVMAGRGRYSERFLKTLDKALAEDIAARPQDAREFLKLLGLEAPLLPAADEATFVRPRGQGPARRQRGRRKWPVLLAGVVAAAVLGAGTYWWMGGLTEPRVDPVATTPAVDPSADAESGTEPPAGSEDAARATEPGVAGADPAGGAGAGAGAPTDAGGSAGASAESSPDVATTIEAPAPEEAPAEVPEPPSEDEIVAGLGLPGDVLSFRQQQLAGALLAYTSLRARFDACQESGCSEQAAVFQQLRASMEPQGWERGGATLSIDIENPRRLDRESCPYMIDIKERIIANGETREQLRTYCTSNGFDRTVDKAGQVAS